MSESFLGIDMGGNNIKYAILMDKKCIYENIPISRPYLKEYKRKYDIDIADLIRKRTLNIMKECKIEKIDYAVVGGSLGINPQDPASDFVEFRINFFRECTKNLIKNAYLISNDLKLYDLSNFKPSKKNDFLITHYLGHAYIASKYIKNGLAIEMGTGSTSIVLIKNHKVKFINSEPYNVKLLSIGILSTPVTYIIQKVPYNGRDVALQPSSLSTGDILSTLFSKKFTEALNQYSRTYTSKSIESLFMESYITPKNVGKTRKLFLLRYIYKKVLEILREEIYKEVMRVNWNRESLYAFVGGIGEELLLTQAFVGTGIKTLNSKSVLKSAWGFSSPIGLLMLLYDNIERTKIDLEKVTFSKPIALLDLQNYNYANEERRGSDENTIEGF